MKIRSLLIALLLLGFYVVKAQTSSYTKIGIASFYADKFEGRQTANGEIYYHAKKTAAHQKLPFGTIVKVTNLENNKFVVVRINDRGPFVDNRIIDLSKSVAEDLDFVSKGLAKVKIEVIANTNDLPDKKASTTKAKMRSYYRLNSVLVHLKGKGVQIGSYTDDENVVKLTAELKSKYKKDVYIEIAQINNKKVYRVIVGCSENVKELNILRSKLKLQFPDCFIVDYK
jgi:rare lipoprotein A